MLDSGQTRMLDDVKEMASSYFKDTGGSHSWDHTLRVYRLCERIGTAEGADMEVLLAAAYLHDIGRSHQDRSGGRTCHAEIGARLAAPLVQKLPLRADQKENILHCIRTPGLNVHRPIPPESLLASRRCRRWKKSLIPG